jgi:uncharacterized protein (DUF1810 family)
MHLLGQTNRAGAAAVKDTGERTSLPGGLQRFVDAQATTWDEALAEVRAGRKRTHWMWFIFPQLAGLGLSSMARHYALKDLAEARAYLAHPVLGMRLREITEAAVHAPGTAAVDVFGSPDDLKLHSSATLFSLVSPPDSVFHRLLARWFDGEPDEATLRLLGFGPIEP